MNELGCWFCSTQVVLQSELAEQNAIQEREFETFREANQEDIASLQEALQESQQMQMQSQRRVTTLQTEIEVQQVKIQELKVTVSRLSEATTCSEGIGGAPTQVGYFDNPDERLKDCGIHN